MTLRRAHSSSCVHVSALTLTNDAHEVTVAALWMGVALVL
jgi:hypothetical protein